VTPRRSEPVEVAQDKDCGQRDDREGEPSEPACPSLRGLFVLFEGDDESSTHLCLGASGYGWTVGMGQDDVSVGERLPIFGCRRWWHRW
jgi:hypothetical protein